MRSSARKETIPVAVEHQIQKQIGELGTLLKTHPYLPKVIAAISNHFQASGHRVTPWELDGAFHGYLTYFHPLNAARIVSVLRHLKSAIAKHEPITSVVDFGSGLGASHMAFQTVFSERPSWHFIESQSQVRIWHKKMMDETSPLTWSSSLSEDQSPADLFISSYALNEVESLPESAYSSRYIVLVEPSQRDHSRQLMDMKVPLQKQGFQIVAPCTHSEDCPLLVHSKQDFCHDRIPLHRPEWFQKLEADLPMKNQTLTFSYLVAIRQDIPITKTPYSRVIGDTLKEKGKTRQAICRGQEREFLSWLKRFGEAQFLPHGAKVIVPPELEKKGNEIRCHSETPIQIVDENS